jgi:hypothetical protein
MAFSRQTLDAVLSLAGKGVEQLLAVQRSVLASSLGDSL